MVKETTARKGIKFIKVTTKAELKQLSVSAVIIKVSSPTCPPCKQLQKFLEEYQIDKEIVIVPLDVSQPNDLLNEIIKLYELRAVPLLAYITTDLVPLTEIKGFNTVETEKMLQQYNSHIDINNW